MMKSIFKVLYLILPVLLFTACSGDDDSGEMDNPMGNGDTTVIPTFKTTYYIEVNKGTNTEIYQGVTTTDKGHSYLNIDNGNKLISAGIMYQDLPAGSAPFQAILANVHLGSDNNLYPLGASPLEDYDDEFVINYDNNAFSYVSPVTGTHSISDVAYYFPFGDGSIPPSTTPGSGGYVSFRYDFNNIELTNYDVGQNYTVTGYIISEYTGSKTVNSDPVSKFKTTYRLELSDGTNTQIYEGTDDDDDGFLYSETGELGEIITTSFGVTGMNDGIEEVNVMGGFSVDETNTLIEAGFLAIQLDDSSRMFYPTEPATGTYNVSNLELYPIEVIYGQTGHISFRFEFNNVGLEGVQLIEGGEPITLSGYTLSGYILCEPVDD